MGTISCNAKCVFRGPSLGPLNILDLQQKSGQLNKIHAAKNGHSIPPSPGKNKRMLEEGPIGFEGGMNVRKYVGIA